MHEIIERYLTGQSVLWVVTDEQNRVEYELQQAMAQDLPGVDLWRHDKVTGVYRGGPRVDRNQQQLSLASPVAAVRAVLSEVQSSELRESLEWYLVDQERVTPTMIRLGLEKVMAQPQQTDAIVLLRDLDVSLRTSDGPKIVQYLRNAIQWDQGEAITRKFDDQPETILRGRRMLVVLASSASIPAELPELKPISMSLPDQEMLATTVDSVKLEVTPEERGKLGLRMRGLTQEAAMQAMSIARFRTKEMTGPGVFEISDQIAEQEKARVLSSIPGLRYVGREELAHVKLVGYDSVMSTICEQISPELAQAHNLRPLRGVAFASAPGLGKTVGAMLIAKALNRIALIWDIGQTQGGIVGQTDAQVRRVLQAADASNAFLIIDDIDKSGLNSATQGYSGDGGNISRVLNSILTETSRKSSNIFTCLTMNRIENVPAELLRDGRMNLKFYVERPNARTREEIIKVHCDLRNMRLKPEFSLCHLAGSIMDGFLSAEIENVVDRVTRQNLREGREEISVDELEAMAKTVNPMCKQEVFKQDIDRMELAAKDWIHVGNLPDVPGTCVSQSQLRTRTV